MGYLRTANYDEPNRISDVLKHEYSQEYCREVVTILSGQGELEIGQVLGQITKGTGTSADKSGGNTGNGTFVIDATTPVRALAKVGVYKLRVISVPATHGSIWELLDPDGHSLGNPVVAGSGGTKTVDNAIKGLLTDGGTDWIVGDGFDITVAAGSLKWGKAKYGAVNGVELAAAVILQKVDATSADKTAAVLRRGPSLVTRLGLKWDATYDSEAKKDVACAQLAAAGIITHVSA